MRPKKLFMLFALVSGGCKSDSVTPVAGGEPKFPPGVVIYDYSPSGEHLVKINGEPVSVLVGRGDVFTFEDFPLRGNADVLSIEFSARDVASNSLYVGTVDRAGNESAEKYRNQNRLSLNLPDFGAIRNAPSEPGTFSDKNVSDMKAISLGIIDAFAKGDEKEIFRLLKYDDKGAAQLKSDMQRFWTGNRALQRVNKSENLEIFLGSACALVANAGIDKETGRRPLIMTKRDRTTFSLDYFLFFIDRKGGYWLHGPSGWRKCL